MDGKKYEKARKENWGKDRNGEFMGKDEPTVYEEVFQCPSKLVVGVKTTFLPDQHKCEVRQHSGLLGLCKEAFCFIPGGNGKCKVQQQGLG